MYKTSIITSKDLNDETTISRLFPNHQIFVSLLADDCEILSHKKNSKQNILNWEINRVWPNENTYEYLDYELHQYAFEKLIGAPELRGINTFFYIDTRTHITTLSQVDTERFFTQIAQLTANTLVILPSEFSMPEVINDWVHSKVDYINLYKKKTFSLLVNYDLSAFYFRAIKGKIARQGLKRKSNRWVVNFQEMSDAEQSIVISALIDSYLNGTG